MRISDWSSDVCSSDLLVRAAVDRDQQFGALRGEMLAHRRQPAILADRQAKLDPAPFDDVGQRAGREDALFVEGAVIGEFVLAPGRDDFAVRSEESRVGIEWVGTCRSRWLPDA